MFFLIMDPVGNLPLFINQLDGVETRRYRLIVLRESGIALGILIFFLLVGGQVLVYLSLTQASIELAGGIVLFLIALKMVFGGMVPSGEQKITRPNASGEPFIVPLAIPFIAGPAMISTCILQGGKGWRELIPVFAALVTAWIFSTLILTGARRLEKTLGEKLTSAMEALMGLLLVAMSVEILISGIKTAFQLN